MNLVEQQQATGQVVRDLRQALGMSHAQVAQEMSDSGCPGIYPQTIVKIEQGTRALKLTEGVVLAGVFGVEPADLLGAEDIDAGREIARRLRVLLDASARMQRAAEDLRSGYLGLRRQVAETPDLSAHSRATLASNVRSYGPARTLQRSRLLLEDLTDLETVDSGEAPA